MFKWGVVSAVDPAKARLRVKFQEDGIESAWLPVLQPFALGARAKRLPRVNTLVAVLLDEHAEDGAVVGAAFNAQDDAPEGGALVDVVEYEDGTRLEYDPEAHKLRALVMGDYQVRATGKGSLQFMDDLELSGSGRVNLQSQDEMQIVASGPCSLVAYDGLTLKGDATVTVQAKTAINMVAPVLAIKANVVLQGAFLHNGDGVVNGNWFVSKKLTATQSSATHQHPVSGSTALPGAP